jgi:toxin ParE1/3/4
MGQVRWAEQAIQELRAIGDHIAQENPHAARVWVEKLQRRAQAAAEMPRVGRIVPEYQRDDLREVLLRGYRIVYRVGAYGIEVLSLFEGHRLLRLLDVEE